MKRERRTIHLAPAGSSDGSSNGSGNGSSAPSAAQDGPFALHPETWFAVSTYVYAGTMLPHDVAQTDVKQAYAAVREHTTAWRDTTFPRVLTVADSIVTYGYRVPILCDSLLESAAEMLEAADGSRDYALAKRDTLIALKRLVDGARANAKQARDVKGLVEAFKAQTSKDHGEIKGVKKKYDDQYGTDSADEQEARREIAKLQRDIAELNEEYTRYVVIAATTPTYAWIPFYGLIPAIVVAGVYTDRAIRKKKEIEESQQRLGRLQAEQQKKAQLLAELGLCVSSLSAIEGKMEPAITALGTLATDWDNVARGLESARDFLDSVGHEVELVYDDAPTASADWKRIAAAADAYRVHAFIQVDARAA